MKELSRFNTGLAAQDLQNQIGNLQQLSGQGLGASGSAAQLAAQAGTSQADIQQQAAQQVAAQRGQIAGVATDIGQQLAGLGVTQGQAGLQTQTQRAQQHNRQQQNKQPNLPTVALVNSCKQGKEQANNLLN